MMNLSFLMKFWGWILCWSVNKYVRTFWMNFNGFTAETGGEVSEENIILTKIRKRRDYWKWHFVMIIMLWTRTPCTRWFCQKLLNRVGQIEQVGRDPNKSIPILNTAIYLCKIYLRWSICKNLNEIIKEKIWKILDLRLLYFKIWKLWLW